LDKDGEIKLSTKDSVTRLEKASITLKSNGDVEVKAAITGKVIVDSNNVELGKGAGESLLLGDSFKTLFNTHFHSGVTTGPGVSGPPVEPNTVKYYHLSDISKTKRTI